MWVHCISLILRLALPVVVVALPELVVLVVVVVATAAPEVMVLVADREALAGAVSPRPRGMNACSPTYPLRAASLWYCAPRTRGLLPHISSPPPALECMQTGALRRRPRLPSLAASVVALSPVALA